VLLTVSWQARLHLQCLRCSLLLVYYSSSCDTARARDRSSSCDRDYGDNSVFCCFVRATSVSHYYTSGSSDRDRGSSGYTFDSYIFGAIGSGYGLRFHYSDSRPSYSDRGANPNCFTHRFRVTGSASASSGGSDRSKFRVRWGCDPVCDFTVSLRTRLVCFRPTDGSLGFGSWCQRGRGSEYVRFRGSMWYGLVLLCVILSSCIHVYFLALWYMCACMVMRLMWHVCSLLYYICVLSLGFAHLLCFRVILRFKWALPFVLVLISYLMSTLCWLGSYKHS
jgi:hypothetical protein